ncbi:MAG: AEC family transporter [Myxococcota bacterium]
MSTILHTIVPVFTILALGVLLGGRSGVQARTLSEVSLWVASPALVFSLLADNSLALERMAVLAGGAVFVGLGTAGLALLYMRLSGLGRGFLLPCVFFNAGNMGLACARLAFGEPGLEAAAIIFVVQALLTSLFGVWIAKGRGGFEEVMRAPLLYGSVGGVLVGVGGIEVPALILEPIRMLGAMAIPLMLLNLGLQLRDLRVSDLGHSLVAVLLRMGGGVACALVYVSWLGVSGADGQVLLLVSVMPAAVMTSVLAERYDAAPALVASAVVLGTACSVVVIPILLWALA